MSDLRRVFFATADADASSAEKILEAAGIEYTVRLEVLEERKASGLCYQGLLFEVPSDVAESCRRLFIEQGLGRGVIE